MTKALPYKPAIEQRDKPIIMVVGRTGVGKSSLVNHLFGRQVAEVGSVESTTMRTQGYIFHEDFYVVDTRGLEEVSSSAEAETQLTYALAQESPQLIMYCIDGGRRDSLDEELASLERILGNAFAQVFCEPRVFLVVNKVDSLAPAGCDTLPVLWPELSTPKGRNIRDRLDQVFQIAQRTLRNEIVSITPTVLEWYEGARPWNFEGLKNSLIQQADDSEGKLLRRFALDANDLNHLLALQNELVQQDIDASPTGERSAKAAWRDRWQNLVFDHLPMQIRKDLAAPWNPPAKPLTADRIQRSVWLLEMILFQPYIKFDPSVPDLKRDEKLWEKNLRARLRDQGFSDGEAENLYNLFKTSLKSLVGGVDWIKIVGIGIVAILVGWWAAPLIGGWIGALMGYSGAVAVNAGLAWLGFGSLAAGGFGMFGGTIVIMGGGAILASASSATLMVAYAGKLCRNQAILDCAKLLTIFESAILPEGDRNTILGFMRRAKKAQFEISRSTADEDARQVFEQTIERMNSRRREKARFHRER